MIRLKKGFSLAELLIVMGIVAVIAAMGFTISKQGIENAYNLYWYTGYKGLYDAITETNADQISLTSNNGVNAVELNNAFVENIAELLKARISWNNVGNPTITAPNNISYLMVLSANTFRGANGTTSPVVDITMTVPQRRAGVITQAELLYLPEYSGGMLMPVTRNANSIDLQNRKDLLPFYIEDGISGKVIIPQANQANPNPNNISFQRRSFYSFREAYCGRYGNNARLSSGIVVVDCAGIQANQPTEGFLQVENPRKIF